MACPSLLFKLSAVLGVRLGVSELKYKNVGLGLSG